MKAFWKKLKSVKLAVVLIALIAAGSLAATLVPQGRPQDEYFARYPKLVAELVVQTGLGRYFSSLAFLVPVLLFFVNLGACTADRLLRELRRKEGRRHGPDILHLGLLVLIVGAVLSFSGRAEGSVSLAEGESVELPGGEILRLKRFTDERYGDGRPKAWTSLVSLEKGGKLIKDDVEIRVNRPLRLGGLAVYQSSYAERLSLVVSAAGAELRRLARGETFEAGGVSIFFMTTEEPQGPGGETLALLRIKGAGQGGVVRAGRAGTAIGPYLVRAETALSSGLEAVKDPGFPIVLAGLLLVGLGTCLTFAQKLKDLNP